MVVVTDPNYIRIVVEVVGVVGMVEVQDIGQEVGADPVTSPPVTLVALPVHFRLIPGMDMPQSLACHCQQVNHLLNQVDNRQYNLHINQHRHHHVNPRIVPVFLIPIPRHMFPRVNRLKVPVDSRQGNGLPISLLH